MTEERRLAALQYLQSNSVYVQPPPSINESAKRKIENFDPKSIRSQHKNNIRRVFYQKVSKVSSVSKSVASNVYVL